MHIYKYSTGRRKTSSARVFLKKGSGKILINNISLKHYFPYKKFRLVILYPFKVIDRMKDLKIFDLYITVKGGGISSQSSAIRHGISRVLCLYDSSLRKKLKLEGLITRDSRKVERKKFGFKKSRCKPQFSKR